MVSGRIHASIPHTGEKRLGAPESMIPCVECFVRQESASTKMVETPSLICEPYG